MGKRRTFFFDGLGVSGGVVLGPAHVLEQLGYEAESRTLEPEEVEAEIERLHNAVSMAREEVQELARTVAERVDPQQAAIFDAHVTLLGDPLLIGRTEERIRRDHHNAEFVLWSVTRDIGGQLQALGDAYFAERTHDLYDVSRRVIKFLSQLRHPQGDTIPAGSIVVANDLGPADTAQLRRDKVAAFVTNAGGPASHTAIMAKALQIPAVVGLDFITHYVRSGDFLIVDGSLGHVILNPTEEQIRFYRERAEEWRRSREGLEEFRTLPAETLDGTRIQMEANIEFGSELDLALSQGAEGIGLFRTEYFFIDRKSLPSESEQEEAYTMVLAAMDGRPVVFRTLDVGGDKIANSIPTPPEANPFLGLRALRLSLAYPELFRCQVRPMLRAARGRELKILLPMVSCLEEVWEARRLIDEAMADVETEGRGLPERVLVGAMIEIPAAALQADVLAAELDFLSIGTNDLVQYTLAVDRVNKLVGHLYQQAHPAVLQLIHRVVRAADARGVPVSVCGEMASDPLLAMVLVGLGVRSLSMSPQLIPPVKKLLRSMNVSALEELAERLLHLSTPTEARAALEEAFREHGAGPLPSAQDAWRYLPEA